MILPRCRPGSTSARLLASIAILMLLPCLAWQQNPHEPPTGLPGEKQVVMKPNAPAWPPSEFLIGQWCSPPEPYITLEQYRRMAEAGLTVVLPPCEGECTVARNKKILDLAHKTGMHAVIQDPRMPMSVTGTPGADAALKAIVNDYRRSQALLGYFITDEPGADKFAGLAEVVAELRKLDPEHPAYINLFPNYASTDLTAKPSQLNTDTYQEYVDRFVKTVHPAMISLDHYQMRKGGDRPGFFGNLAVIQRAAVSTTPTTPFWNIVQSLNFEDCRAVNEDELRFLAMQTLAFGGQGLLYFTYWQPSPSSGSTYDYCVMKRDGTPGPLYEPLKRVNRDLKRLGRWLLGTEAIRTFETGTIPPDGHGQSNDLPVSATGDANLTIGAFRARGGYFMAVVANRDYKSGTEAVIRADAGKREIQTFDLATNKWKPLTGTVDADGITTLKIQLSPAAAVLIRW